MSETKLRVISLGAGVQSTTMALMAAHGEIDPMPDCAIFADTGSEPKAVYRHLDWLEELLPFPVHRVTGGDLMSDLGRVTSTRRDPLMPIPAFTNGDGKGRMARRSCTRDYKIRPIIRKVRELAGLKGKRSPTAPIVEQWIGISTDEAIRMKPSRDAWIKHRWPLIEKRMSRQVCLAWLDTHGYPRPQKSACIFCPYMSDAEWSALAPDEFAEAIRVDGMIRNTRRKGEMFLHRSCKPLSEVELVGGVEPPGQLNLFLNECEGMCGV